MKVYLVTLGYDYGDAEYGPKYSKAEVLIEAESAKEAEAIADQLYGYSATGEPYEGCWATEATQDDIDRLEAYGSDEPFPFNVDEYSGDAIQAVEGIDGYGQYDGTPSSYFTRDDIVEFAYDVIDKLNERTGVISGPRPIENWWDLNEVYFKDDGYTLYLYLAAPSGDDFEYQTRIDMRRARDTKSLIKAYSEKYVSAFIKMYKDSQYEQLVPISDSTSIKASYWDDEGDLDYSERKELAEKLYQVVKKYFSEDISGWPSPRIDYNSYDMLKYTFTIQSGTRSVNSIGYQFDDRKYDLNEFKNEFKAVLKPYGFNRFKFDLPTRKRKYDWWGETKTETYRDFYAVYFDKK